MSYLLRGVIFSLEKYLESHCSFGRKFLCVDGGSWKDSKFGQPEEEKGNNGGYYMCKRSGESIDHLFLHCEAARELWNVILSLFGVERIMPRRVIELLDCQRGQIESFSFSRLEDVPFVLMWSLQRKRNARCLEDCEANGRVQEHLGQSLYIWTKAYNISHFSNFLNLWISVFLLIINEGYLLYTSCALRLQLSELLTEYIYL